MTVLEWIAERRISEALRRGAFDGLAGRGQPLNLEDDSAVPPEWRAAFRMLKSAGLLPDWIALGREIDLARARLRAALAERRGSDPGLEAEADALNRRIRAFNLLVPHASLQKPSLKV